MKLRTFGLWNGPTPKETTSRNLPESTLIYINVFLQNFQFSQISANELMCIFRVHDYFLGNILFRST